MKAKLSVLFVVIMAASYLHQPAVVNAVSGGGNSRCVSGHTAAPFGFWTWPANSQVSVYLREPDFSAADAAAVRVSVQNWDESAVENGSRVHFSVRGLTRETKTANGDMTLIRGDVYDKNSKHLALLQAHSLKLDQMIDYAVVVVDVRVRNPDVLTNVIAHEIGHTLGLLDCYKCSNKSTAMGLMGAAQESNGIEGPTTCDKQVVVAAYRDLLARGARAAAAISLNRPVVDEGEEPEEDDTPVVRRP
jgi:hypothetical protein